MQEVVVSESNFDQCVEEIGKAPYRSFDTETTGLYSYKGHRLFAAIFCIEGKSFYFNFQNYEGIASALVLPRSLIHKLESCFRDGVTFMHNAKFDWHMLDVEGVFIRGMVWDTMLVARLVYNDYMKYDLASCAERIGEEKSNAVEEYIKKQKLWEWITIPGKKARKKDKFYDQVPFDIIVPYGHRDAIATYKLGKSQSKEIGEIEASSPRNKAPLSNIVDIELNLTRVCKEMERRGVKLDEKYCEEAIEYERLEHEKAVKEFKELSGFEFKDSPKSLGHVYTAMGLDYPLTAKGNPCFNDAALANNKTNVSEVIKKIRTHEKRMNTYFRSYLYYADKGGVIHPNMRQGGTATGRFSYSDPNLQNIPKEDDSPYPVRRAFIPRKDFVFVSIDYDQMEFRLMLDYAKEEKLIGKIIQGHDPHQATADIVGLKRKEAKTLNFGLLYGMGVTRLADTLEISVAEAKGFKRKYFSGLTNVQDFLWGSSRIAKQRKRVYDWAGRIFHYPDTNFAYKAPNSIIQGGCASIVKVAMQRCADYLGNKKSRMLIQIHDELLFEVHKDEMHIVPELVKIMEEVYPHDMMPMKCSAEWSDKSFGDLKEYGPETRVAV